MRIIFKKPFFNSFICVAIFCIAFLFSCPNTESAQEDTVVVEDNTVQLIAVSPGLKGSVDLMNENISLDLRSMDIVEALKFLAGKTGLNIITTKNVSGRITLTVEDVKIKDVFDIMLRSNSLAYDKRGKIYNVMTETEYKTLFGKNFYDSRVVTVFRLKYAVPEQAFVMLDTIKSDVGRIVVDTESGNIMIMDTRERIAEMEEALAGFEKRSLVKVFTLQYAKAKDIEDVLKSQLDIKKAGSITADERTNQVIVQTLPDRMLLIEELIKQLDKQTKEVLIDAKIVKVRLSDDLDTGVEWEGLFNVGEHEMGYIGSYPFSVVQSATADWQSREQFRESIGGSVGAFPFSGTADDFDASTAVTAGEAMHIGVVSEKTDFDTISKMLRTLGETKVISNPKLVAVNNQEARIHVGEKQAYVTTTTTAGQTTSTISEEVTFIDVGIQLSITPTINDDGFVTMRVKPEISSVASVLTTPTGNEIPIVDTSTAETTVMVRDGHTIIIGGLRREDKALTREQVPFLGNLPILNFLFGSTSDETIRTELIVMLTPHIISGKTLTTGDERSFGYRQGKDEYRDYGSSEFKKEEEAKEAEAKNLAPAIEIKSYKDYSGLKEEGTFTIKEEK